MEANVAKKKKASKKAGKKSTRKPAAEQQARYRDALDTLETEIRQLPYFSQDELAWLKEALGNTKPGLEKDKRRLAKAFSDSVQGLSPFVGHALLLLLRKLCAPGKARSMKGRRVTEPIAHPGDLSFDGTLQNDSVIVALGDVTIDGNYVALPEYPCLYVGGRLRCRNYYANEALTLALDGIDVEGLMFLQYNHTITIAPEVRAKRLVQDDASIDGKVLAEQRHQGDVSFDAYVELLGDVMAEALSETCSAVVIERFLNSSTVLAD